MAERRLGLIMHGVTGRMGYNQHRTIMRYFVYLMVRYIIMES